MQYNNDGSERLFGIAAVGMAYFLWGLLPIYWKLIAAVPPEEILAHRFIWSAVFMLLLIGVRGKLPAFCVEVRHFLAKPRRVASMILAAVIICINWGVYIWAVNSNRVIEASLGYYINPLVTVLLGMVVLKERLTFWQTVSFLLALAGVLNIALRLGVIPWAAIIVAVTFALYGLAKKLINLSATTSITLETLLIAPLALLYLAHLNQQGQGVFSLALTDTNLLLMASGVATAVPLILFSSGARRLPLATLGFLQYLAPTISLMLGIFLYAEPFTAVHAVTFGFIWLALAIFSLANTKLFSLLATRLKKTLHFKEIPDRQS